MPLDINHLYSTRELAQKYLDEIIEYNNNGESKPYGRMQMPVRRENKPDGAICEFIK